MKKVKFKFLKERIYNNKKYLEGEIVEMPYSSAKVYLNFNAGKIVHGDKIPVKKDRIYYNNLSYKEIQSLCKKNNISAVGKKNEMIEALLKEGVNNVS